MVEAVLSDIDGTLVESNWLHAAAWKGAFAVIDIPLDIETVRRQIGKGGEPNLQRYFVLASELLGTSLHSSTIRETDFTLGNCARSPFRG